MYAIVKTGGKQYRVEPGAEVTVEKLEGNAGDTVTLTALCVVDGTDVQARADEAASVPVMATIVEQLRGPKQVVFKLKKRKNYRKKQGHRQALTRLFINAVGDEKADSEPVIRVADEAPEEIAVEEKPETAQSQQAFDDAQDERESEAAIEDSAEAKALDARDETAEEASERDDVETDVEMADIQYEAESDIPQDAADDESEAAR